MCNISFYEIFILTAPPARSLHATIGSGGKYESVFRITNNKVVVSLSVLRLKEAKSKEAGCCCNMGYASCNG
jgi:hypothetical protein